MSTIRKDFEYLRECGSCPYISYSFSGSGWLVGFVCHHPKYLGRAVELYDFCHIGFRNLPVDL